MIRVMVNGAGGKMGREVVKAVHNDPDLTKAYFIPSGTKWNNSQDDSNRNGASIIAYNQRNPMYRIIDNMTSFNDLNKRVFWRHVFASVYNAYMGQITTGTEAANSSFYTMTRCITMEVYSYDNVNYKKIPKGLNPRYMGYTDRG